MLISRKDSIPSKSRLWYNEWVKNNASGNVLDVGKSKFWDYGFPTIDTASKMNPTFLGNIEQTYFKDNEFDLVLCNGMYECVENPQKMVDEVLRIGKKALFGFVGKDYKPYRKQFPFYNQNIDFHGTVIETKDFNNEYHFILCQSN